MKFLRQTYFWNGLDGSGAVDIVVGDIVLLRLVDFISFRFLLFSMLIRILRAIVSLLIVVFVSSKHLRIYVSMVLFSPAKGSLLLLYIFGGIGSHSFNQSDMIPGTVTSISDNAN